MGFVALLLASIGWGAPAMADSSSGTSGRVVLATPPTPAPVSGHLLSIAATGGRVSAWASSDLTALESAASLVGNPSVATTSSGAIEVAGRTATGDVVVFSSKHGLKDWSSLEVTTLADAPLAAGAPSIVVDQAGVTRIFYRTGTGQLEEMENDRRTGSDPWFSSDLTGLTSSTLAPTISGDPVALSAPGYPPQVFARAVGGDLVSFTLTSIAMHPWYFENVSELALGPPIEGMPAVVPAPDGYGLTAVYAVTRTDQLVEFSNDDYGWHLWSVRDVSGTLKLPAVASSPTAIEGLPAEVATVSTTGHVLVVSIPTVTLHGASVSDLTSVVHQSVEPESTVSIAATSAGYAIAGVTTARHLVVFDVPSTLGAKTTVSDATVQPLTEQLIANFPSAVDVDGATDVFADAAGFIGLTARIVLDSESQDQSHAAVIDTPSDTNCNPFTAAFGRGTTAGCVTGTASEEWCSDFADWVWTVAGLDTTGIDGAAKTFVTWGQARGQFLQGINAKPAVGDAVVWGVLDPLWGAHVGIVVGVRGSEIDVVSGNSGVSASTSGVWESGYFAPASQTAQGDPIIGYVSPVPLSSSS